MAEWRMPRPQDEDLLFPAWDTTMGDGCWPPGHREGPLMVGKLSPFRNVHCPYADPRWAGSHRACHFDALGRTWDAVNTHTRLSCRVSGLPAITLSSVSMALGPSPAPREPCQAAIGLEACPPTRQGASTLEGPWGSSRRTKDGFPSP